MKENNSSVSVTERKVTITLGADSAIVLAKEWPIYANITFEDRGTIRDRFIERMRLNVHLRQAVGAALAAGVAVCVRESGQPALIIGENSPRVDIGITLRDEAIIKYLLGTDAKIEEAA